MQSVTNIHPPDRYKLLNQICELLLLSDGRDAFCKLLQYQTRVIMFFLGLAKFDSIHKFTEFNENLRFSRKWFKMLKWVKEYQKFMDLVDKPLEDSDDTELFLLAGYRIGQFGYYFLDNLYLLATCKVIRFNPEMFFVNGQRFRWCGLICKIVKNFRKVKKSEYYLSQLEAKKLYYKPSEYDQIKMGLHQKRKRAQLQLVKGGCDFVIASYHSGVLGLFRMELNDLFLGLLGSISAAISLKIHFKQKRN